MSAEAHLDHKITSGFFIRKRDGSQRVSALRDDDVDTAKPWDRSRSVADDVERIFLTSGDISLEKQAQGMSACSGVLRFAVDEAGRYRLTYVRSCKARFCPVCQWRKSLKLKARFLKALPGLTKKYPKARWVLLTLTVKNCALSDLSETINAMNRGWARLQAYKELKSVLGWTRAMEITKPDDPTMAHPHFHCLLMVSSTYYGKGYIKQNRWAELWRAAARLDYDPVVDVRPVKAKKGMTEQEAVGAAAAEALKYSLKGADMVSDSQWLISVAKASRSRRFLGTGGALKGILCDEYSPEALDAERGAEGPELDEAEADEEGAASEADQVTEEKGYRWSPYHKLYVRDRSQDRLTSMATMKAARRGFSEQRGPITPEYLRDKARRRAASRREASEGG